MRYDVYVKVIRKSADGMVCEEFEMLSDTALLDSMLKAAYADESIVRIVFDVAIEDPREGEQHGQGVVKQGVGA
jgi:hypothetical protein